MPDLDAVLARIGLDRVPSGDAAEVLRTVHRQFVTTVPYENLTIHLGRFDPLDLDTIAARVLHGGRGGYCFELNGLLGWTFEQLGFTVHRHEGRAGARDGEGPTNHLALVVEEGERRWLCDAGLGEGWLDPLLLVPGAHLGTGPFAWHLAREEDGGWWIAQHPWGSIPGFAMRGEPADGLEAFAPHHERLSQDPESPFVATVVAERVQEDRITTLRARTLTTRGPTVREKRVLAGADELAATLRDVYGIDPDALDLDRLWSAAAQQHERHLAATAAA